MTFISVLGQGASCESQGAVDTHERDALLRREQRAAALLALTRATHPRSMRTMTRYLIPRRQARAGRPEARPQ